VYLRGLLLREGGEGKRRLGREGGRVGPQSGSLDPPV